MKPSDLEKESIFYLNLSLRKSNDDDDDDDDDADDDDDFFSYFI